MERSDEARRLDKLYEGLGSAERLNQKFNKEIEQLQAKIDGLEKKVGRVEALQKHYEKIGFCQTAKKIDQALKETK